ncbi:MAG: hypothetical protein E6J86_11270 [Deltaproteobacteria bacterium]|nr:MAG: hypothetical protein E6J86_11270 [Deltaproteobacteria bacterium]
MLDPKTIRNVAIIAHDGAGKTCLTEALLRHDAPARASKDGSTSHLDVDPEETKRGRWRCAREGSCSYPPSRVSNTRRKRTGKWRRSAPCPCSPA